VEDQHIVIGDLKLLARFARPERGGRVPAVLVVPGFPRGTGGAASASKVYESLVARLPDEVGWAAMTLWYRGTGPSGGDFSIDGWRDDLAAAVDHLLARTDVSGLWLVGFRLGGSLAIVHAAADPRIRGLATFAAPASLRVWAREPQRFRDYCRRVGVLRDPDFPADVDAWARSIADMDPLLAAAELQGRPWLLVHGSDDDTVPLSDAQALASACPTAAFRVLQHGAHRLRHDPRAIALLLGWLAGQG
jgi:pimeloyl-ACP methyl ester carboxylesterase